VDQAPTFPEVMLHFEEFLVKNGLYDPKTGSHLIKYTWCCDGPWDLRDFFVYARRRFATVH
jgi:3'-5' exoribonuclease 1